MTRKEFEETKKEFEETKKEISQYDIIDVSTDIMAESKVFKKLILIDPTLIMTLTMFTTELVNALFDEAKEDTEKQKND